MNRVVYYKTERGGDVLGHEGYEYVYITHTKLGRSWRCRQYRALSCKATAKTVGGNNTIDISKSIAHCHPGNPLMVEANMKRSQILEDSKPGTSNRNTMGRHLVGADQDVLSVLPKKTGMSCTLPIFLGSD